MMYLTMSDLLENRIKVGRRLHRTTADLPNGIKLEAKVPTAVWLKNRSKVKARWWVATRRDLSGAWEIIGEHKTWQKTVYTRKPEEAKFGSAEKGTYSSVMQRESWILNREDVDTVTQKQEWVDRLKELPTPVRPRPKTLVT